MMEAIIFLILFLLIFPKKVLAYLDPGSGSYFIQLVIGTILGGVYLTKAFWLNLLKKPASFLKQIFSKNKS